MIAVITAHGMILDRPHVLRKSAYAMKPIGNRGKRSKIHFQSFFASLIPVSAIMTDLAPKMSAAQQGNITIATSIFRHIGDRRNKRKKKTGKTKQNRRISFLPCSVIWTFFLMWYGFQYRFQNRFWFFWYDEFHAAGKTLGLLSSPFFFYLKFSSAMRTYSKHIKLLFLIYFTLKEGGM